MSGWLCAVLTCMTIGSQTYPYLLAWNGQNNATEHLYVSDDTNAGAARFYARNSQGLNWAAAMAAHGEGTAHAVGLFAYGENASTEGEAWGANLIGASYGGGPAVGVEVNGVNRSGAPANVHGLYVSNGGNAQTRAAITVQTSLAEPLGKPRYGIMIIGESDHNPTTAASEAGILIDHIDNKKAIIIAQGDALVLSHDSRAYLYFDGSRVRLVRDGVVRATW